MANVEPLRASPKLVDAANNHLCLEFGDCPEHLWQRVVRRLETALSMHRDGQAIAGPEERIEPSFINQDIRLLCGWDHYSGHYLLAECNGGDAVLRDVHRWLSESCAR